VNKYRIEFTNILFHADEIITEEKLKTFEEISAFSFKFNEESYIVSKEILDKAKELKFDSYIRKYKIGDRCTTLKFISFFDEDGNLLYNSRHSFLGQDLRYKFFENDILKDSYDIRKRGDP